MRTLKTIGENNREPHEHECCASVDRNKKTSTRSIFEIEAVSVFPKTFPTALRDKMAMNFHVSSVVYLIIHRKRGLSLRCHAYCSLATVPSARVLRLL